MSGYSFKHIPARTQQWINVVVDTPAGSSHKYKFDNSIGYFIVSHALPRGMHFPYDFGSIPGTMAEDGDALDVMVLSESGTFTGCLQKVKLIGAITAIQSEGNAQVRNDRLIAVPANDPQQSTLQSIEQVDSRIISEIEGFFVAYNAHRKKMFRPEARVGADEAEALLNKAIELYSKELERG